MLLAGLFAIASCVLYGGGHTFVRRALSFTNSYSVSMLAFQVNALLMWLLALLIFPGSVVLSSTLIIFLIDGALITTTGRMALYEGFDRVGVSRAAPISGSSPLFSALLAVIFLRERLTLPLLLGTASIVVGIALISQQGSAHHKFRRRDILFPLLAAFVWGVGPNIRRWGLTSGIHPVLGAAISSSVAAILVPIMLHFIGRPPYLDRKACAFIIPAAIINGFGFLFSFFALARGNVVVVAPLLAIYPLFSLLFSFIFLREMEKVTGRVAAGALLLIAGAVFILSGPALIKI